MSASKSRRIPQTGPAATKYGTRAGGYVFLESDSDSDSDNDTRGHGGGAKLNQSPYRPPQLRKSLDQLAQKQGQTIVTPDSTESLFRSLASSRSNRGTLSRLIRRMTRSNTSSDNAVASKSTSREQRSPTETHNIVSYAASRTPKTPAQTGDMQVSSRKKSKYPMSDRHLVGDLDAQHFYSHTSCVFIANLPQSKSDQAIEAEVTRRFHRFGTVYVKIKRDFKDMPFGFLQFTNDKDAATAIEQGAGQYIFDRACRLEIAKANRTFVVFRRDGSDITVDDAICAVAGYGALSRAEPLDIDLIKALNPKMNSAILIEFASFDCERDLVNRFYGHPLFRVRAFDIENAFKDDTDHDGAYLDQYKKDRKMVHVCNLPRNVSEDQLRFVFEKAGDVVDVVIVKPEVKPIFAFIEFVRDDMAARAIKQFDGQKPDGFSMKLKVEQKRTKTPVQRRVKSSIIRDFQPTPAHALRGSVRGNRATSAYPTLSAEMYAQADLTGAHGEDHFQTPGRRTGPTPPVVVSPAAEDTTSGGADMPGQTQLSALAPAFGPQGYFSPYPNAYNGPVGGQFGFQQPSFGNMIPFQQSGFVGHPMFQPALSGFVREGQMYCQDHNTGMIFSVPQMTMGPIGAQAANVNRSASAIPTVSAEDRHVLRRSQTSMRSKKSVTFADPIDNADSSTEEDTADNLTDPSEQDANSADEGGA